MSGDSKNDIVIPMVFLFNQQGNQLKEAMAELEGNLQVYLGFKPMTMGKGATIETLQNDIIPSRVIMLPKT